MFDITQLRKIRQKLDLTQQKFSKEAGVSQSMIAKIEAGKLDPTYSYVRKIEGTIERLSKSEKILARDVMNRKAVSVNSKASLRRVIDLMVRNGFSQMPVVEKGKVIGLITEGDLLEADKDEIAGNIMRESPPVVSLGTEMSVLVSLLKFYPIVLVVDKGKLNGIVTKSDILQKL